MPTPRRGDALEEVERVVLLWAVRGRTNGATARHLRVWPQTVGRTWRSIQVKLGARSSTHAAMLGLRGYPGLREAVPARMRRGPVAVPLRDRIVLRDVAVGYTNAEISALRGLSRMEVEWSLHRARDLLGVTGAAPGGNDRLGLCIAAWTSGLVRLEEVEPIEEEGADLGKNLVPTPV